MTNASHIYTVEFKPFGEPVLRYIADDGHDAGELLSMIGEAVRRSGRDVLMSVEQGVAEHRITGDRTPFTAYRVYDLPDVISVGCPDGTSAEEAHRMAMHALAHALTEGDTIMEES